MAPLKRFTHREVAEELNAYPWLKGHGSFEACALVGSVQEVCVYPWLKGHGSFEAFSPGVVGRLFRLVSMAERSWLL